MNSIKTNRLVQLFQFGKSIAVLSALMLSASFCNMVRATPVAPTDNISAPYMGNYGWGLTGSLGTGINHNDYMASWLYRSNLWVEEFEAYAAWTDIENSATGLKNAKQWVAQHPNGTFILTVPMLPGNKSTPLAGTSLASGAAHGYDAHYITLAQNLVNAHMADHMIIRLGHEFNGNWYAWHVLHKNTDINSATGLPYDDCPANFVAYFQNIVTAMRGVTGAANLKFCWNGAGVWSSYPVSDAYPGDSYVDYVGIDVYDQSWAANSYPYPAGATDPQKLTCQQNAWNNWIYPTYQNGIVTWKNLAVAHSKPLAIPEWGVTDRTDGSNAGHGGLDNTYFVQQMYNFIQDPANNVAFHIYFDVNAGDGAHQITQLPSGGTTEFPQSAALVRKLFGMPVYPANTDIGTVGIGGGSDALSVTGAGSGYLAGTSDNFHFASRAVNGDDITIAQVNTVSSATSGQYGLMLRQSTAANAVYAALFIANGNCIFQSRTTAGGTAVQNNVVGPVTTPLWLKMVRSGNLVTGYTSSDGLNWSYAGGQTVTMTSAANLGFAVSSGSTTVANTANVDNVDNFDHMLFADAASITNKIVVDDSAASGFVKTGAWTQVSATGAYNGALQENYSLTNVTTAQFSPTIPATGTYEVYGTWVTSYNRPSNLPLTITSLSGTATGTMNQQIGTNVWLYLGTYTFGAGTSGNVYLTSSGADGFAIADAMMFVPEPVPALPAPKTDADIGAPPVAGSAAYSGGVFTVQGCGNALWSTSDQLNYVSQGLTGDKTLIARITGFTNATTNGKAGVMFRNTLDANSVFIMEDVSPGGVVEFRTRDTTGASSASTYTSTGTGITPSAATPLWVKLVKTGSNYYGYYATTVGTPTSTDWRALGSRWVTTLNTTYLGGLSTSSDSSTLSTAVFDNVSP